MIDDSTKMTNATDVVWCDFLKTASCLAEEMDLVNLVKDKSSRRTAATAAPISYTSAQRTSVREGIADLLREVAIRWCEDWHLQLPYKMSDALKASKNGGEVEAPTSESTHDDDVRAGKGLFHIDEYIEELTRPLSSKCGPF